MDLFLVEKTLFLHFGFFLVFFGFFFGGQTLKKKLERALHVFGHLSSLAALLSQEIGERPHTHREREERESDRIRHIKLSRAKAFVAEAERERECIYSITRYKNHGDDGIRATSAESRVVLLLLGVLLVEFILLFSKEKDFDYDHAFVVPGRRKSNRVVVVVVVFIFFFFFFFFSRKESQSESCERVQAFESDS